MEGRWRMPSASSLEMASKCAASHFLPLAIRLPEVAAQLGTRVHAFIVRCREIGRDAALAEIALDDPGRERCERIPIEALGPFGEHEVALAYNHRDDSGRKLGQDIGRAYVEHGLLPHEIAGTADVIGGADDFVWVMDWKTGQPGNLPPAAESLQLGMLALAACRAYGKSRAKVAYWFILPDGSIKEDAAELDAFDLLSIAKKIRKIVSQIGVGAALDDITPNVALGNWCRYCGCKESCPAQTGLIRSLIAAPPIASLTRDDVGEAYLVWEAVKQRLGEIEEQFKAFAREAPLTLPDGRVLREIDVNDDELIMDIAHAALADEFGNEIADAAVEQSMTKASITRALRKRALRGQLAGMERDALQAIGRAGGITVRSKRVVRAFSK